MALLYDSRDHLHQGIGFPSTSTEVALRHNERDPQGYYAELGVDPWATAKEIRFRVRQLYRTYHPDTGIQPDVAKFQRIHNIATVLLDPESRAKYDATPEGMRLMDAVYEAELSKLDLFFGMSMEEVGEALSPPKRPEWLAPPSTVRYDYFALNHRTSDSLTANLWYHTLIAYAHDMGYRGVIKVLLHDNISLSWDENTHIVMIPRSWRPVSEVARQVLTLMTARVALPRVGAGV